MSKMVYKWKPGSQVSVPAEIAGPEIERVRMKHAGFYKPSHLVEASESSKAPLHSEFEWNDKIAGHAHRVWQAQYITRSIITVNVERPDIPPVRAFVSVMREDENNKRTPFYTSVDVAMSDEDMRQQLLNNAIADIEIFERKYAGLEALSEVIEVMRRVRRIVSKAHEMQA